MIIQKTVTRKEAQMTTRPVPVSSWRKDAVTAGGGGAANDDGVLLHCRCGGGLPSSPPAPGSECSLQTVLTLNYSLKYLLVNIFPVQGYPSKRTTKSRSFKTCEYTKRSWHISSTSHGRYRRSCDWSRQLSPTSSSTKVRYRNVWRRGPVQKTSLLTSISLS